MHNSTLCYVIQGDQVLMLHRVKKKNDVNKDKWIGIGGKFEQEESPDECLLRECWEETGLTLADVIQRVYREPMPNRFLASLAPFIKRQLGEVWVEEMVTDCFRLFFRRNVAHYHRPELPCSFVGSIAFYFMGQLCDAAKKEGFLIGKVMKEPLS